MNSMNHLYIGLDGGGTHTTVYAVRRDGTILSRAGGPGLNYLTDGTDLCVRRFRDMLLPLIPGLTGPEITVCAGLAALDGPAPPEILSAFRSVLPSGCQLILESDLSAALAGLTRGKPGMMAVCGTGSMLMARDAAGRESAFGGWGWKIGDPGSGFSLARESLFRALFRWEAEGKRTPLLEAALAFFTAEHPRDLIPLLYEPSLGTDAFAAFGAEAVRLAETGDPDAGGILAGQMEQLAALAGALLDSVPEALHCVGLYGGVFQHSAPARDAFSAALRLRHPEARPEPLTIPPAMGAVILAMLREGISPGSLPAFQHE